MLRRIAILLLLLLIATFARGQDQFANVPEAMASLANSSNQARWAAVNYLAKHPEEAVPQLFRVLRNQEDGWIYASAALVRSNDPRVLPFLLQVLRDNLFLKEADGSRKQFGLGTKNGCFVMPNMLGSVVAEKLAELGDQRAIPTLSDAAEQGDSAVRNSSYAALYKLGGMSLDDLFAIARKESNGSIADVIEEIGWRAIHSDTQFAIRVFDRIMSDLPNDEHRVASAHFWKIRCFEELKEYDAALRECEQVMKFTKYDNLVTQASEARIRLLTKKNN